MSTRMAPALRPNGLLRSRSAFIVSRVVAGRGWVLAGIILYVVWAANVSWPLLKDPADSVLGGIGDQTGGIAIFREWIDSGVFPFAPGTIDDLSAPGGLELAWGVNISGWGWTLPVWLLALVVGPTAAFALTTWLGLVLTGVVMQAFATRATGSRAGGLVAGFAFAFFPYIVMQAATHPGFCHGWPLALAAWRLIELADAPTRRNTIFAALAALVAIGFNPYYLLIGAVLIGTCMLWGLGVAWRHGALVRQLKAQAVVVGVCVLYVAVLAFATLRGGSSGGELREHSVDELVNYAARLHEYVVPFSRNVIFGDATAPFLQARQHGSNFSETTLYLGLVVLLLGLIAVIAVLLERVTRQQLASIALGLLIAVVGVVWSAPPQVQIGGSLISMPADFVGEITTTWRVYARFALMVMIGACLLAAAGIGALTQRRGSVATALIATIAVGAIAIDFTWRPGVTPIVAPPVYQLLKERPGGLVAQYPLLPAGFGDNADLLYQEAHGHRLLNGYSESGFEDRRASTLYYLNQPRTARGLASIGVRYVIFPDVPVAGTADPGRPGRGFSFVGKDMYGGSTASVFRVTARPDLGYPYLRLGAGDSEGGSADPFFWIVQPRAEIAVDAPACSRTCNGRLTMRIASFGRPRDVVLRLVDGRDLWRGRIGRGWKDVDVPLAVGDGRARIEVATSPGPIPIQAVDPANPDVRAVSVQIARLRYTK